MTDATAAPARPTRRIVWRLLGYVARHKRIIVWSVLAMLAAAAGDLLLPEAIKRTVDGPIRLGRADQLPAYAAAILGLLALGALARGAQTVLSVRAGREIGMSLRTDVFDHLQRQSLRYFDRNPVGVLTTRVTGDVESIENFFASGVAAALHDGLKLLLIILLLLVVNARLAIGLLVTLPLLYLAAALFSKRSRRDFRRVRGAAAATNGFTAEAIEGVGVTRLFQREQAIREDYDQHVGELMQAHLGTVRNFAFFFPTVKSLEALAIALVITLGAKSILAQDISPGEFLQFWFLIDLFFQPIRRLSDNLNLLLQAGAAGERVFGVLDTPIEILPPEDARPLDTVAGHVRFDHARFGYDPDDPVLHDVSFEVPAGSTVAIVGPTGAGKSSILSLISRFYDVQAGSVQLDGVDVRHLDPQSLRRRIALVLQDVFLFRGSVLENIRLFDPSISREQVHAAIQAMRADNMVSRLQDGLDAQVEERGSNLSVGERQLIAFARALVHDPTVLVLDEATSSIDTETEQWIQEALDTLRAGRTTVIVAHRLSTIRAADEILVLQRGRVVERGDHRTLLAQDGLYRRLYELQVREPD